MSWTPLAPVEASAALKTRLPVTMAMTSGKRRRPAIVVVVRPQLLEGLVFMKTGETVQVELGAGEHRGQLRITPKGPFPIRTPGGRAKGGDTVMLLLPPPPGVAVAKRPAVPVDHDWQDGWLEVTLPEWARPAEKTPAPVPSPRGSAPFRLADGVPDPAAEARARAREGR